jgi:DNA polymerase-3 subunit epsilon
MLGLEKVRNGKACFASQLKKCLGACAGQESIEAHNQRVIAALQDLHVQPWPYQGAIGIREDDAVHVIDCWAYLGTAASLEQASALVQKGQQRFDRDVYQILQKRLPRLSDQVILI